MSNEEGRKIVADFPCYADPVTAIEEILAKHRNAGREDVAMIADRFADEFESNERVTAARMIAASARALCGDAQSKCYHELGVAPEVAAKLLLIREALSKMKVDENLSEAWHHLYSIASPGFDKFEPWQQLEAIAANQGEQPAPGTRGEG